MEIIEVTALEFDRVFTHAYHVFGSGRFCEMNEDKVDSVYYLIFREKKKLLGLTVGIRDGVVYSPFSAPFGGFMYVSGSVRIGKIDEALQLLETWAINHNYKAIRITLPPSLYSESFISKQTNALFRAGYLNTIIDLNYSFNTEFLDEDYPGKIWRNAKKNLKIAMSSSMAMEKVEGEGLRLAYDIIQKNREARGFPLRMTWENVEQTINVIPADFFIVKEKDGVPIASAIVFHVASGFVQVIYWGDIPDYSELKVMNFLSFKVFEYYKQKGIKIIDIGPSTENSIPNFGLCEFKEGVGCEIHQKQSFIKEFA